MSQVELSYEEMKQNMIKELQKHQFMVLATAKGELVTARTMLCSSDGLTIYFTTPPRGIKYVQIMENPNVALASGNLSIQGVAKFRGHPLAEGNTKFIESIRETQPDLYERLNRRYRQLPNYQLVEITPRRIALWVSAASEDVPESYVDILNVEKEQAHRVRAADREKAPAYWE